MPRKLVSGSERKPSVKPLFSSSMAQDVILCCPESLLLFCMVATSLTLLAVLFSILSDSMVSTYSHLVQDLQHPWS